MRGSGRRRRRARTVEDILLRLPRRLLWWEALPQHEELAAPLATKAVAEQAVDEELLAVVLVHFIIAHGSNAGEGIGGLAIVKRFAPTQSTLRSF